MFAFYLYCEVKFKIEEELPMNGEEWHSIR